MSIRFRAFEPVDYVSFTDPAIDQEKSKSRAATYRETFDPSVLVFKPGTEPSRFRIARLTRSQWNYCKAQPDHTREDEIIAYGLRGFSNVKRADGTPIEFKEERSDLGQRVSAETLDAIHRPFLFMDLAAAIERLSNLGPLDAPPSP